MGGVRFAFAFVRLSETCLRTLKERRNVFVGGKERRNVFADEHEARMGRGNRFAFAFHALGRTCSAPPWGRDVLVEAQGAAKRVRR